MIDNLILLTFFDWSSLEGPMCLFKKSFSEFGNIMLMSPYKLIVIVFIHQSIHF
jgi:hypothetical protein